MNYFQDREKSFCGCFANVLIVTLMPVAERRWRQPYWRWLNRYLQGFNLRFLKVSFRKKASDSMSAS
jgi:hypothetical protein